MSSVDDRIVNMQFNNKQFLSGATESQKALEGLDRTLANTGKSKGLVDMASTVDQVSTRFGALQVAGVTAIATIANKAVNMGLEMARSLTIAPIMDGFREYETNLKSVQTIMANTGEKINVVNKYLADLNHYSDQTIYNFSQMADSIGKFTAAGVKLPAATDAIKGMANTAALTGASSMQLNSAMYQMSQALASGTIKLMDWNSLVNANMGTENVQKALMATNRTLGDNGKAMDAAISKYGTFRDSLQEGWLSAETFTKTMKVMAGETKKNGDTVAFTVKELQKMGYAKDAAEELHRLSAASIESATKIKTFTQLLDVVKESVGSGFAQVFQNLFGNLKEAGALWTNVGNRVTGAVGTIFDAVNAMLVGWKQLGGYTALWNGFGNIFQTLGNLIKPFVAAFQTLLPSTGKAGEGLADASKGFEKFTAGMEKLSRGAVVLTPILVTVAKAIKTAFGYIGDAFGYIKMGVSAGAEAAEIGANIIRGLTGGMTDSIGDIGGIVSDIASNIIDGFKNALGIHSPAQEMIPIGVNIIQGMIEGMVQALSYIFQAIGMIGPLIFQAITGLGSFLSAAFQQLFGGMDSLDFASLLNAVFTGALLLTLRTFAKNMDMMTGGILGSIHNFFAQVGNSLNQFTEALGTEAKAKLIMSYAIAIGVLAASLLVLSFLDVKTLTKSLTALGVMLGLLVGSLYALGKVESEMNMGLIAASILMISVAMVNLALAVTILGQQDMKNLAVGLGAMAIALGILVGAIFALSKISGSIEGMAGSILVLSIAVNLLAGAVLAFGLMDMKTLAKGLGAMAIGLGLLVGAMLAMDKIKGSVEGLAGSILIMAGAMILMATAVGMLGNMDMGTLAKGITFMAIGLGILVAALMVMAGNSAGVLAAAGAMVLMAAAMNMIVGVILILGTAPWETVAKGLGFVAAALGVFLLAGLGAMYVAPGLLALGISLGLIGAALFLAGAGMLAFGTGFALLAGAGVAGVAILVAAFQAFIALLPSIAIQMAAAFVSFLEAIAMATPRIRDAVGKIFEEMIGVVKDAIPVIVDLITDIMDGIFEVIQHYIPKLGDTFSVLIETVLKVLRTAIPDIVDAATDIALALLEGIRVKIPQFAKVATDIILEFLNAIADNYPRLVDGAAKAIIKFINGLADAIDNNASDLRTAGLNLAGSIIDGLTGGLLGRGLAEVRAAATALANELPGWMKKVLGINSPAKEMIPIGEFSGMGVAVGLDNSQSVVEKSATELGRTIAKSLSKGIMSQAQVAVQAAVNLANAIIAGTDEELLALQKIASDKQAAAYRAQAAANLDQNYADRRQRRADQTSKEADKSNRQADRLQALADRQEEQAKRVAKENAARAKELRKLAAQNERAANKMEKAANGQERAAREQQKAADKAQRAADKAAKAAEKAQKAADAAAQRRQDAADFKAADLEGKGDILTANALSNADKAQQLMALAEEQAARAKKMLQDNNKKNDAEAKKLLEESKKTAAQAQKYAEAAQTANNEASKYYQLAKEEEAKAVYARISDLEDEQRAREEAAKAEAEYNAADTQGKADILEKRAAANEAKAAAAQALAAAAMNEARSLALVDAEAAMKRLDYAEEQANLAEQAAQQARQEKEQAAQLLDQLKQQPTTGSGGSGGSNLTPSRGVLEDAANVVNRYSASLAEAEALAASAESPVQFVQNNYSPEALSASEIYRQSRNLLSTVEIKMGAN